MLLVKRLWILFFIFLTSFGFGQNQPHYYVLFSARSPTLSPFSIGGHAFITWRSEDSTNQKFEQYTYGFFPKKGMGLFKNVEGTVVEGYTKNSNKERFVRRFILEVDSIQFFESLKEVELWKTQAYNLFNNNCVNFMNDVAAKLSLDKVSTKSCLFPMKPYRYIKKLRKLNSYRITKNVFLEKVRLRILRKVNVEEEKDDEDGG
jgi:hypothetical protein